MANFWTDLNRHLGEYELAEYLADEEERMVNENSDYAVNGEDADLIPEDLVTPDTAGPSWWWKGEGFRDLPDPWPLG
jgi:hypothetical protein